MNRFNKFVAEKNNPPATNGYLPATKSVKFEQSKQPDVPMTKPKIPLKQKVNVKRESEEDDELSDVPNSPPPKKKRKPNSAVDEDAAFAARLQAEENSRARPTRGGATRKSVVVKKKKKSPKKKTSSKVKAEDDSDLEGSGSEVGEKKVNRSGGFHVRTLFEQRFEASLTVPETSHTICTVVCTSRW